MLAKSTLLRYNNYSDKKRVIICVLKGILDVCFSVKSTQTLTARKPLIYQGLRAFLYALLRYVTPLQQQQMHCFMAHF